MVGWLVGYPSVGALGVVQLLGSTAPVTRAGAAASFEKLCSASNPNRPKPISTHGRVLSTVVPVEDKSVMKHSCHAKER